MMSSHQSLVIKVIGQLVKVDADQLEQSLRGWLGLLDHNAN
jgi:mRNA interferase MazF